jgi:hypothetical protein
MEQAYKVFIFIQYIHKNNYKMEENTLLNNSSLENDGMQLNESAKQFLKETPNMLIFYQFLDLY